MTQALELHVERSGTGPLLVLGHGFGGSARNFRPQARALGERATVVCFDARGHARSPAPEDPEAYSSEAMVQDLSALIESVGGRAVVGGLSMGAHIALELALSEPQRVRGLVLAAYPGAGPSEASWALEFADAIDRDGLEAAGARFAWGERARFDPKGAALIRQGFLEHSPHALAAILRGVLSRIPSPLAQGPLLAKLSVPVLMIVGSQDQPGMRSSSTLERLLPDAELVVVEGAGHVVNLAAPRAFNDNLGAFLTRLG